MKTLNGCDQPAHRTHRSTRSLCALVTLVGLPAISWGLGVRVPNQDAEATARGNAFVATADNPSAIYYNPAGIIQIQGTEAQLGMHAITIDSHFEPVAGRSWDTKFEIQGAPQLYSVYSPSNKPYAFGIGMYARS